MSRTALPLPVDDLSRFAKSLREQLDALGHMPGHVEMLNACCRAAGYRNYQHFRAGAAADAPSDALPQPDLDRVEKVSRHFDADGMMMRWPSKASHAELCLWVMWSRLPAGEVFTEREISEMLADWHSFGDHALLRRGMVDARLVSRTVDGREYRRIEQRPPAELSPLLRRIGMPVAA
jgi:hypothetical protein